MSKREQALRSSSYNECPTGRSPRESATGTKRYTALQKCGFSLVFISFWGFENSMSKKYEILSNFEQPGFPSVCSVRKQVDCGSAMHHNRYGFPTGVAEGIHRGNLILI